MANVEGIELMSFRALWFIVAGFILGFTVSTLWEWLYYRKQRQQTLLRSWEESGPNATLSSGRRPAESPFEHDVARKARRTQTYRSSGVLLENETLAAASELSRRSASAPDAAAADEHRPTTAAAPTEGDRITDPETPQTETRADATPSPLTVALLTAQKDADREERAKEAGVMADTITSKQTLPTQSGDTPTPTMPLSKRATMAMQEDAESLGNPAAIARAGAMAAASLASRLESSRTVASAVNAGSAEEEHGTTEAQDKGKAQSPEPLAAQPSGTQLSTVEGAATRSSAMVEKPDTTTATPLSTRSVATRSVAAQGFAQRTPLQEGQSADSPTDSPAGQHDAPARTREPVRQRPSDYPDDLAMIKGIGEAYKRRLYATGIYTWRQLAEADTDSLRRITRAKPNADIGSWITQALALAEKYGRTGANFTGPLDDFTRIEGVGAITADILYKAGICTYEQLASASPDELARIVPAPTVGNENDFDGWINDAARFAGAKRRNHGMLP